MTTLSGIYPKNYDNFIWARDRVSDEVFKTNNVVYSLWKLTSIIVDKHFLLPSPQVLKDSIVKSFDAGTASLIWKTYETACGSEVSLVDFRYAVDQLVHQEMKRKTGEAIATSYEILESGFTVGKEDLKGHEDARNFLIGELTSIDRQQNVADTPEGNISDSIEEMLAAYKQSKESEGKDFILTGLPSIDANIGGIAPGDLAIIAGYTSHGKSMLSVNLAWQAAVLQGKNVVYATSETVREQILNRLVARHSRLEKFGLPEGLDHKKIKTGQLTEQEELVFYKALKDFRDNEDYGNLYVMQLPSKATLSYVEAQMMRVEKDWHIDMVVIDYLGLLKYEGRTNSSQEKFGEILKEAKVLATSFNGKGVAVVSPWQINRNGFNEAKDTQEYTLTALSDASEAEKSPDLIFSLFQDQTSPKTAYIKMLKTRGASLGSKIQMTVDYRNSYFKEGAAVAATTNDDLFSTPGGFKI